MVNEQDYVGFAVDPATGKRHNLEHLPEDGSDWEEQIYRLEEGDAMIAGIQGVMNLPIQELTNRTAYLKTEMLKRGAVAKTVTLSSSGWAVDSANNNYVYTLEDSDIKADMIPVIIIAPESAAIADNANLMQTVKSETGKLFIWADNIPEDDIIVQFALFAVASTISSGDIDDDAQTLDNEDVDEIISGVYPDDDI